MGDTSAAMRTMRRCRGKRPPKCKHVFDLSTAASTSDGTVVNERCAVRGWVLLSLVATACSYDYSALRSHPDAAIPTGAGGSAASPLAGAAGSGLTGLMGGAGASGSGGSVFIGPGGTTGTAGVTATAGMTRRDGGAAGGPSTAGSGGVAGGASGAAGSPPDARPEDARPAGGDGSGGAADTAHDAAPCVNGVTDLSNIGTGDFHISFRVATTQTGWVALLNQRSTCYFGMYWDISQCGAGVACPEGALIVQTDDTPTSSATYQTVHSTATINDGNLHDVEVARVSGVLTIQIDGAVSGTGPSAASLGAMPALRIGTSVCGAANSPPFAAFAGTMLSDVCITSP
jgi:hypothetical protein